MILLPIVERELRVASRQWRTYWARTVAGGAALGMVLHLIWAAGVLRAPGSGAMILKIVSYLSLAFCVFAGMSRTADCISSEKRDDTLGLLFLTHLKARDIVLGKLAAASIHSILSLISIVPVLAVPVMLGGVSASDLMRVPLSLANGLLMSLGIGMISSAIFKLQRQAALAASTTLVLLVAILPGSAAILNRDGEYPVLSFAMWLFSPLLVNEMALGSGMGLSGRWFWQALAAQLLLSSGLIAASCLILPRSWQVKGQGAPIGWKLRFRNWVLGSPAQRQARRARFLERNPIFWLGARDRFGPLWPALFFAGAVLLAFFLMSYYDVPLEPCVVMFFMALGIVDFHFRVRAATLAAMLFGRERQMGTWEMILSTPLTVQGAVRGNWMAIRHHLLKSYIVYLVVFACSVAVAIRLLDAPAGRAWVGVYFGLISIGEFFVLGYAGMWQGMRNANPLHAPGQALLRVTLVPWMSWMVLGPAFNEIGFLKNWFESNNPRSFFIVMGVVWTLSTALAFRTARRNLRLHFRAPEEAPSIARWAKAQFRKFWPDDSAPMPRLQPALTNAAAREK